MAACGCARGRRRRDGVPRTTRLRVCARVRGESDSVRLSEVRVHVQVLRTLVTTRQHKLWIVDDDDKPTGVVSVSDICKLFAQLCDGTGAL